MTSPFPRAETRVSPVAYQGGVETLFTEAALAASNAWSRSSIVSADGQRKMTLFIDYNPAAAGGYPTIIVLGSTGTTSDPNSTPGGGDDVWWQLSTTDGSVTSAVLAGTLATGSDFTVAQPQGNAIAYPLAIRLTAATNATDEYRQAVTIDVGPYKWIHIQAQETSAGSPGTLGVYYSFST